MQQRNLIIFAILSITLIASWYFFIGPPESPKEDPNKKQLAQNEKKDKKDVEPKPEDKKPDEKKQEDNKKPEDKKPPEKKPPEIQKPPEEKQPAKEDVPVKETLGGDGFHLTVQLTSRGAGVRSVTLNRFKAADWKGLPTDRDLELIQDDEFMPSFRMYHWQDARDTNPVFGLGEKTWKFEGKKENDDVHEARFSTTVPEMEFIKITKVYKLAKKDYHVTLLLEITDTRTDGKAGAIDFRYQLTGGHGLPIEGEWYTSTYRNAYIGLLEGRNLWRKLEDSARISGRKGGDRFPTGARADNKIQYAGVANQFFGVMIVVDDKQPTKEEDGVNPSEILAWARPTLESMEKKGMIKAFVGKDKDQIVFMDDKGDATTYTLLPRTRQHLKDLDVGENQMIALSYYKTPDDKRIATWARLGTSPRPQFDDITVRVNSEVITLTPKHTVKHQFMLYHGPVKAALLNQFSGEKEVPSDTVDRYTQTLHLRTLTDYPSDNWFGWISSKIWLTDLIIQFTRLMHWLLHILQSVVGSYGISIIILTVMVRGAMYPISRKQAMFSNKMQELAPELKKIQDKYPDDPQAKMQATQDFYRKHGINPLGSCWPVFLQMPIFLGLYFALQESIHFRLASFLWIENLAAPDMLLWWSEEIPWISQPDGLGSMLYLGPYLNILPMIAVVFMMIQQLQTMPPPTDDQQAMQQKLLKFMTIFFGLMFYKVAAGLCIYFIASSLWGMCERKLLPKKKNPALEVPATSGKKPLSGQTSTGIMVQGKNKWSKKEKEKVQEPVTTFDKLKALWREILKQAEKK